MPTSPTSYEEVLRSLGLSVSGKASLGLPGNSVLRGPILLNAGPLLTTPIPGMFEFDGTDLYFTNGTSARINLTTGGGGGGGGGAFQITAFAITEGNQELGASLITPHFTATYNKTVDSVSIGDNQGNPSKDVLLTPNAFTYENTYAKNTNNASIVFTLSAQNGTDTVTRTVTLYWRPRVYWGIGVDGLSTEANIKALSGSALLASRASTFTVNPGAGQYIYYAFPTAYGVPVFTVDGWEGGFDLVATNIPLTLNGVTQNYTLYQSVNDNFGTTTVVVS